MLIAERSDADNYRYRCAENYASQAPNSKDNKAYQQQCASELSSFHTNLAGAESILRDLGRDRGLANYDRNNELETTLKDLININKRTLKAVDEIVYQIPVLGPILGPSASISSVLAVSSLT